MLLNSSKSWKTNFLFLITGIEYKKMPPLNWRRNAHIWFLNICITIYKLLSQLVFYMGDLIINWPYISIQNDICYFSGSALCHIYITSKISVFFWISGINNLNIDGIGSHSEHKGSSTLFAYFRTVAPHITSICLHSGWLMEYLKIE